MRGFRTVAGAILITVLMAPAAIAAPILIDRVLLGDPRPENPDGLRVLVSISGDTTSNVTSWTVDLDMATTHPNARLDEFGFNLLGAASDYTFGGFNLPYTPIVGTLNGSGNTTYLLTLNDPNGNRYDATNIRTLTFNVTKNTGFFTEDDFFLADPSCSSNDFLGCNQLGAHLQALNAANGQQDSGVAVGNYSDEPPPVPEPASMLLLGAGVAAGAVRRMRKQRV